MFIRHPTSKEMDLRFCFHFEAKSHRLVQISNPFHKFEMEYLTLK